MCKICGRGSCMESFHSIEEQEAYEEAEKMDTYDVMQTIVALKEYEAMEKWMEENSNTALCDYYNREESQ